MVEANAAELSEFTIELETFFIIFNLTDAYLLALFVPYLVTFGQTRGKCVERGLFGAPEFGILDDKDVGCHLRVIDVHPVFGYHLAGIVGKDVAYLEILAFGDIASNLRTNSESSLTCRTVVGGDVGYHGGAGEGAPGLQTDLLGEEEAHGAIESCTGVPA